MIRPISNIKYSDSTINLKQGDVFLCVPNGERFISQAINKGCKAVLKVAKSQLGPLSSVLLEHPSKHLTVIGVTGTNGKTTVTHIIAEALRRLNKKTLLIGTISHRLTTPDSVELQTMMRDFLKSGGDAVVMEVSSHGIDQHRIDGIEFNVKVLTNITHDHLDYHHTFEAYRKTKLTFMTEYPGVSCMPDDYLNSTLSFSHSLKGDFNIENMKAAASALFSLGLSGATVDGCLIHATAPEGRFQCVSAPNGTLVIIDYAHTPDGLYVVSKEAKKLAMDKQGKLITLFGCGGNRDTFKRPKMAEVASKFADSVVLTSDNPRDEHPEKIMDDIVPGLVHDRYHRYSDRKEAIYYALGEAKENDVVLIAGKGHEKVQVIGSVSLPFSDIDTVNTYFSTRVL